MSTIKPQLDTPTRRLRGMTAKGLAVGDNRIDPTGGKFGAGIIKGFAVVTRGEALGHGVWLDSTFVRQTRIGLNAAKRGLKSRFTHPGLSSDGMGKGLGRAFRAQQDGDIVRSDLHFSKSAHNAPDGNLAEYVMGLATEDPDSFGSSIVFDPDFEAEEKFFVDHGGEIVDDPYDGRRWDASKFKSPDELNTKNLPHARLKAIRAVDIVDEPAANPSGLFGRDPIFAEAEQLMLHAAGMGEAPRARALGVDPDRVLYFFTNFLARHDLVLSKRTEQPMSTTFTADDLTKFRTAFGDQGTEWLLAGKKFEECEKLHAASQITALSAKVDELTKSFTTQTEQLKTAHAEQLAALTKDRDEALGKLTKERDEALGKLKAAGIGGEKEPVTFGGNETPTPKKISNLPDGLARFAAGIGKKTA